MMKRASMNLALLLSVLVVGPVVAGKPLADALAERVTRPLRMADTTLVVPADKRAGIAQMLLNPGALDGTRVLARMAGSASDFFWPGAFATDWWADPKERMVVVSMMQGPFGRHYQQRVRALVYQAIAE